MDIVSELASVLLFRLKLPALHRLCCSQTQPLEATAPLSCCADGAISEPHCNNAIMPGALATLLDCVSAFTAWCHMFMHEVMSTAEESPPEGCQYYESAVDMPYEIQK